MRTSLRVASLFFLVLVISSSAFAAEIVVPFISGQADMTDAGGGKVLPRIEGFASYESPGNPSLPYIGKQVLLPPDADVRTISVEIRNAKEEELPGTFDVAPTPPMTADTGDKVIEDWGAGKQIVDGKNTLIYSQNSFYPSSYATISYESRLGPYLMVPVKFWPYRYNPATGKLTHLISGDVAVIFNTTNVLQAVSAPAIPEMAGRLQTLAVNWQQAGQWYPKQILNAAPATATPFAIITTSAIVSASTKLADYVTHKTNMGYLVTVATESDWGGGTGDAAAEHIKTWLKLNYATKAHYAVLIGNPHPDTGDVPMKKLWPRHTYGAPEDGPSDYYYADMTGNWDRDADGFYGEDHDFGTNGIDRIPEVIVGRLPYYGTMTDLDKILQKIITYESSPTVGGWAQRMLLPMVPLDPATQMWELGELIKTSVARPAGLGYYRLYGASYGLNPPPEAFPCSFAAVQSEWQKGYGFVFWATHGSIGGASNVISTGSTPSLPDAMPSIVFQGSCDNGRPESSGNLGYCLLKNGAISTASASRLSWYFPGGNVYTDTDSIGGMTYYYALRVGKDGRTCGEALYDTKTDLPLSLWPNHVVFNLYGDPSVKPRWPTSFSIDTTSLPTAKIDTSYLIDLRASGGTLPYVWSLESGELPTGMDLSVSGVLYGIPTVSGVYNFVVRVTEHGGATLTKDCTLRVILTPYVYELDSDPGWQCDGGWQFGQPMGLGSFNHDPTSGHTGTCVYGYNLNGDYPRYMQAPEYLRTPPLDCSSLSGTTLTFWRWIGVNVGSMDHADIDISTNGTTWTNIWTNTAATFDLSWQEQRLDISSYADGQPTVYVRWGMGPTGNANVYPGWNIDDIKIEGNLTKPIIFHTPYEDTEATTGSYTISANVIAPDGLSPNSPMLHWKTTGELQDVPMSLVSGRTYSGAIPAQPRGTTVSYYISAADSGGTAVSPTGAPTTLHHFYILTDVVPPTIVHTPPLPNTKTTSGPYDVYATVTDNLGVASVMLSYAKNGGTVTTVAMTKTGNLQNPDEYKGSILGSATSGDWFTYRIVATDVSENQLQSANPTSGWNMFSILPSMSRVYRFLFTTNPGWTCEGGWAFGVPTGGGTNGTDPTRGLNGMNVYGYNLSGNYTDNMTAKYLTTTPIDCGNIVNTRLMYYRWLGVQGYAYDKATVSVSNNGTSWTEIWHNPTDAFCNTGWIAESMDISTTADLKPTVYVRWGMGPTSSSTNYPGWNIDGVEIWGNSYTPVAAIPSVKPMAERAAIVLTNQIVTAAYTGYFYIKGPANYQGIRVAWPGPVTEGVQVTVRGMLRTRGGEREIVASAVVEGSLVGPVKPLMMNLRALGGRDYGLQPGVSAWRWVHTGGSAVHQFVAELGLNNIGTLAKVSGKVTQTGTDYFYIDDGSGIEDGTLTGTTPNTGVRVAWPGAGFDTGDFVSVTGISSGFQDGGNFLRCLLPRRAEDIQPR